jgi:hypothetical protein
MAGFFSALFGGGSTTCCYVGHWCETPIKFSNKIETPGGSKVSKVKVCVDIWYTVEDDQIIVARAGLSKGGSSLGDKAVNVATMRGEAFYAASVCDDKFLKQAVESDVEDDSRLRKRMLAKWRGEHGGKRK